MICECGSEERAVSRRLDLANRLVDFALRVINVVEAQQRGRWGITLPGNGFEREHFQHRITEKQQSAESRKDFIHFREMNSDG